MTSVMATPGTAGESPGVSFDEAVDRVPFLRALPSADRERLRPYTELRRMARSERIWRQGDPTTSFAFAVRGRVKLVKTNEAGREMILALCGPGELLCASAVCSFAPYCCAAGTLEDDVEVAVVPRRDVLELLERSPEAARAFLREVTGRGMRLCERVEQLSTGLVERRIATLLSRLAEQLGVPRGAEGTWIPIELSRQDLADLCGTTIETAIRTMTRLGREGVVRSAVRGLVVIDRPALERIARGTAPS
jgi:CRP/FNR family transcriptional regulator